MTHRRAIANSESESVLAAIAKRHFSAARPVTIPDALHLHSEGPREIADFDPSPILRRPSNWQEMAAPR
jgi:hypothetical protein